MGNKKAASQDKSWPMFPLDAKIHTEPLRVCKSLIPYLPFDKQKNISIFIKLFELMAVIDYYSEDKKLVNQPINLRDNDDWQRDLLETIKDNLDPDNAFWIDIIFKFNDVQEILSTAQSPTPLIEDDNNPKEFIENISPMLDDNQQKMLKMLSAIMK